MRRLLLAFLMCLAAYPALAQSNVVVNYKANGATGATTVTPATPLPTTGSVTGALPAGQNIIGGVGAAKHLVSTTLTKISGGGTYGGTATAPQAMTPTNFHCIFIVDLLPASVTVQVRSARNLSSAFQEGAIL